MTLSMEDKVIYDSNVWIASMITQDSLHQKAISLISENTLPTLISQDVIAEIITVLKRLKKLGQAKTFVDMIYANKEIEILTSTAYYQDTIDCFLSSNDTKLSFVDMSLVVLSQKYQIETFDKALKAAIA